MRSCEDIKAKKGERNTHLIRLRNIEFWGVHHQMIESKYQGTFQTQAVSLTLEEQKNSEKWTETHKKPQENH